jgi:hypothetical protein
MERDRVSEEARRRLVRFAVLDGMLMCKVQGLPNVLGHIRTTATVMKGLKGIGVNAAIKRELDEMLRIGFSKLLEPYWNEDEAAIKRGEVATIGNMLAYQFAMGWADTGNLLTDEEVRKLALIGTIRTE